MNHQEAIEVLTSMQSFSRMRMTRLEQKQLEYPGSKIGDILLSKELRRHLALQFAIDLIQHELDQSFEA